MHRPLRVPLYIRIWHLIKGILFYNTVYWEKASDGLNMPKISREERESSRPKADLDIIRPREKPRAKLNAFGATQVAKGGHYTQISEPPPVQVEMADPEKLWARPQAPADSEEAPQFIKKRRRYKRRRTSGADGGDGFFRRVFGK